MTTMHTFDTVATTTTTTTATAARPAGRRAITGRRAPGLVRRAAVAGIGAAAVNTAIAAAAMSAGVDFEDRNGDGIPLLGFPQMTLLATLLGVGLAVWCARRARQPRPRFVTVAGVLTVLSLVPPLLIGIDAASQVVLEATHLVAAAVVIPAIASRLRR